MAVMIWREARPGSDDEIIRHAAAAAERDGHDLFGLPVVQDGKRRRAQFFRKAAGNGFRAARRRFFHLTIFAAVFAPVFLSSFLRGLRAWLTRPASLRFAESPFCAFAFYEFIF